ncbi:unnamed protein product, partial [Brassica rapa subsp. narinosa]
MARFPLLCFLFAAALTSSLTSAGDENHVYSPCSDSTARSAMDSFLELPSRLKIFFFGTNRSVQYSPCDHCRLSLHAIVAASRSTETLSSLCSDPKSMRSPFSPSIPLPVPLVIVRFVLVSLIYNGEFWVLIAD